MPGGEGVLEVHDGEDEAEELSEGHHKRDRQRGALCSQDENTADAHVPEETVKDCSQTRDTDDRNLPWKLVHGSVWLISKYVAMVTFVNGVI